MLKAEGLTRSRDNCAWDELEYLELLFEYMELLFKYMELLFGLWWQAWGVG